MKYLKFIFMMFLLFSSYGCASFYDATPDKPVTTYTKPTTIDQSFDISGRFIIKQPEKNSYGNFTWNKAAESEVLNFNTPLGQTVAQITIESGVATLTAQGKTYTGDNLDAMMQEKLGFVLPMNYLHYWIQGVGLPNVPVTKQLVDGFVQLGWNVEYLQWSDSNHPQIVQCSKDDLVIKLLIEW